MKTTTKFLCEALDLFGLVVMSFPETSLALKVDKELTKVTFEKIEDYHECHQRDRIGRICQHALQDWLVAHPADTFRAAKMTRVTMKGYAALPLFRKAFDAGPQDCRDTDLKLASYSALDGLFAGSTHDDLLKQAQYLVFRLCFDSFKEDLSAKMSLADPQFKTNVCAGLKQAKIAKSKLPTELASACL